MGDESGSDWDSISEPQLEQKIKSKTGDDFKTNIGKDTAFDFSNEIQERKNHQNQSQNQVIVPGRHRPKPVDAYNPASLKGQLVETAKPETEFSKNVSPKSKPRSRNLKIVNNNNNARNSLPQNSIGSPQSNLTSKMEDTDSVITAIQKHANQDLSRAQRFGSDGSLMGLDNPAFQDISYSIEEKGSNSFDDKSPKTSRKPNADELIRLIQFEPPVDRYFSIKEDRSGAWSDNFNLKLIRFCDKGLSEVVALAKIPFVIVILILGHIFGLIVKGLIQPLSDFLLKPLLATVHNFLCVPLCGFCHNSCNLTSHAISPLCNIFKPKLKKNEDNLNEHLINDKM